MSYPTQRSCGYPDFRCITIPACATVAKLTTDSSSNLWHGGRRQLPFPIPKSGAGHLRSTASAGRRRAHRVYQTNFINPMVSMGFARQWSVTPGCIGQRPDRSTMSGTMQMKRSQRGDGTCVLAGEDHHGTTSWTRATTPGCTFRATSRQAAACLRSADDPIPGYENLEIPINTRCLRACSTATTGSWCRREIAFPTKSNFQKFVAKRKLLSEICWRPLSNRDGIALQALHRVYTEGRSHDQTGMRNMFMACLLNR